MDMILAIYGAGGLGTELAALAEEIRHESCRWSRCLFVDDDIRKIGTILVGLPVLSFEQAINEYGVEEIEFIIAIGEPSVRAHIYAKICASGAVVTDLISPDSSLPAICQHGSGLVVRKGNDLPVNSSFGNNVLIQSRAILGHDLKVGDNVVISSLSFIGGNTAIGRNTYIAPGALIRNGLHIGENAIVGMGAVVVSDVPDGAVVVGNPARIVRYNENHCVLAKQQASDIDDDEG